MEFEQAVALQREGRNDAAAAAYQRILRADPAHAAALLNLGCLRLMQAQAGEAEALLRRAVAAAPDGAEAHASLGAALQQQGRLDEAAEEYERALALNPEMPDARFAFAVCLQSAGRNEQALACYEALLQAQPDHAEANFGLGRLLAQLGRNADAAARFQAAIAADATFAEAYCELGRLLAQANAAEQAVGCFRQALAIDPDYTEAQLALAQALAQLGRADEALAAYGAVLAAAPDEPDALVGIGGVLDGKGQHAEAIAQYRAVLARVPEHTGAMAGLANSLRQAERHAEALPIARRLMALRPDWAAGFGLLARILAETGALAEAQAQYRQAVSLAPGQPELLFQLAQLARVTPDDGTIAGLEAALPNVAALPAQAQCLLHFALAKAYGDTGAPARGFDHLLQGNAIKRSITPYDEAATLAFMARIRDAFSAGLLAEHADDGDPSEAPVFIVGMPRSGTTLVEQILASHPAVFGAGERPEVAQLLRQLSMTRIGATTFPELVWTMPSAEIRALGAAYVAALRPFAGGAARIVDKMPDNFCFVGMIRMMLPRARIIHVMRDPVDTCLSCFATVFAQSQPFSYDLAELGRYYRAYRQHMRWWRTVLPAGAMLEVQYEAIVDDLALQAQRIVSYCGLPWDPACLAFHETARPVLTASLAQVRQPIYRSSVQRWRPEPALLRPLLDALGDEALRD